MLKVLRIKSYEPLVWSIHDVIAHEFCQFGEKKAEV
jgi:hypothetical protein